MWIEFSFVVWMSVMKVSLEGAVEQKFDKEDRISHTTITAVDHLLIPPEEKINPEMAQLDLKDSWMNFRQEETEAGVQLKQIVSQKNKPVKSVASTFLIKFAEAFSKAAAFPVTVAIALVNKLSDVTNRTLYVGGEITKLPVTITSTVVQELSNITFPN